MDNNLKRFIQFWVKIIAFNDFFSHAAFRLNLRPQMNSTENVLSENVYIYWITPTLKDLSDKSFLYM